MRRAPALCFLLISACGAIPDLGDAAWPKSSSAQEPQDPSSSLIAQPSTPGALPGFGSAPRAERTLESFAPAAKAKSVELILPWFEQTPAEVHEQATKVLAAGEAALASIAAQDPARAGFRKIYVALDDAIYPVSSALNRWSLMKETQPDAAMREACAAAVLQVEQWLVGVDFREDLHALCAAFDDEFQRGERAGLRGEDLRLYEETMRDYRRNGFSLTAQARAEVQALQNRLAELSSQFDGNVSAHQHELLFDTAALAGAPASFLESSRTAEGRHRVRVHVTPDVITVLENVSVERTRREVSTVRHTLAVEENSGILAELLQVRAHIASLLGYESWADYRTEIRMAGTGAAALAFVEDLITGLEPKFRAELEVLAALKAADTHTADATIEMWDYLYYQNRLLATTYGVDASELRNFFVLDRVLEGMFLVYEHLFGLRFHPIAPTRPWVEDLRLYVVEDAHSREPLGAFYLDLFPREGKYNHFAQFDVISGKRLPTGVYRRPVAALVCNFTPAAPGEPTLMTHDEVETLFHEFGHCMHAVLTRAEYARFAGGSVPRDFVEAPSQMFENWVWDPDVLAIFAADWRDPSRGVPERTLLALKQAELATKGVWYRRQLGYALADLRLHQAATDDVSGVANRAMAEAFLPVPPRTHFAAYWGHLTGYDAGYYGYAWADSIAADLATAFEEAPEGYLDAEVGMRLRREIYQPGGSRSVEDSVRAFLGRPSDARAFLHGLGLGD